MKSTLKNPICITIVAATMILAIIFTGIAIFILPSVKDEAPKDQGFKLEDLFAENIGSGNLGGGPGGSGGGGLDLSGGIGMGSGGGDGSGGSSVAYEIYVSKNENVYLRIKSFGDYNGRSWSDAKPFTEYSPAGSWGSTYSGNYLSGYLMSSQKSYTPMYIEIKPHTSQYAIPYYTGISSIDNYDVQKNDVVTEGTPPEKYNMYFYSGDVSNLPTHTDIGSGVSRDFEYEYRRYVKRNYLNVDDETRDFMKKKIEEIGIQGNTHDIIQQVSEYISNAAVYDLKYDRSLDSEDNIAIAFLDKYKTGICQHYATAATLLFRTLGIPARYTIGYAGSAEKHKWLDITSDDAHAWVEVYIDGRGWMYVEVTGSSVIQPPPKDDPIYEVTLRPENAEQKYDGTTLVPSGRLDGFEEFEAKGYSYAAEVEGSQTELGKSYSKITSLTIYDPTGKIVTDQFKCTYRLGTLHVYRSYLGFVSDDYEITYDGQSHRNDEIVCYLIKGELYKGHTYQVIPTAHCKEVGYVSSTFDVQIIDLGTGATVTDEYKIITSFGRLKILPRNITFKAGDAEKVYDGTALTCDIIEIINGSLAPEHKIDSYKITGTQTEIGRSENIIDINSIKIVDSYGNNVTHNYAISTEKGKLRVTYK